MDDENARELSLDLSFLTPDKSYRALIFKDGEKAGWEDNPTDISFAEVTVNASQKMSLILAPGGGQAIRFTPVR